jgi:TRAP-type C4-dicarboxylate transport system permease small subunit
MNQVSSGMFRSGYKLPSGLDTTYHWMLRACDFIAALALSVEVILITTNVTGRFVFNHTFGWMDEFSQYTLLWLIVPGSVVLMERYALFYAEVLLLFIENRLFRKTIFVFNAILMLTFFAIVFWTGIDYVRITWTFELDYSDIRKYVFYSAMPTWGLLMFLVVLKKLLCMEDPEVTEIIDPEK